MNSPSSPVPTIEVSICSRVLALRHDKLAQYRLQEHCQVSEMAALFEDATRIAAVANWLWALDTNRRFNTPEDVAAGLEAQDILAGLEAIIKAIRASLPPEDDAKKKSSPDTPPVGSNSG